MLQGAGAGTVFALVRAIIRDTSDRDESASRLGYVMTAMLVIPMFAPGIGGLLNDNLGWASIFWVMAASAALAYAAAQRHLGETNLHRDPNASTRQLLSRFPVLLRDPRYLCYVGVLISSSMAFFSFIGAAPYVVVDVMGRRPEVYGYWFLFMSSGYMLGNFLVGRLARRWGTQKLIGFGVLATITGALLVLASLASFGWSPAALFVPMFVGSLGNGLTMPSATAAALSVKPQLTGAASGLAGAIQLGFGATASTVTSFAVQGTAWALPLVTLTGALVGLLSFLVSHRLVGREYA
jgi:DHA1 family bicyclomycin/chloramphenicol resistance-like MFS transporter